MYLKYQIRACVVWRQRQCRCSADGCGQPYIEVSGGKTSRYLRYLFQSKSCTGRSSRRYFWYFGIFCILAGSQPRVPPKTQNSTELTNYFLGWTQIHFRKMKLKIKFFFSFWGKRHDGLPGLWGAMAGLSPLDPPVAH